jgi:hypothetical protein
VAGAVVEDHYTDIQNQPAVAALADCFRGLFQLLPAHQLRSQLAVVEAPGPIWVTAVVQVASLFSVQLARRVVVIVLEQLLALGFRVVLVQVLMQADLHNLKAFLVKGMAVALVTVQPPRMRQVEAEEAQELLV